MELSKNKIKYFSSFAKKKVRDELNLFVVEGNKMVEELLRSDFSIDSIVATKDWIASHNLSCEVYEATYDELSKISLQQHPQDVWALARYKENQPFAYEKGLVIALDGIQDPGNMGTIIRLADWFGVMHVVCSRQCVDVYNPKVVQATMGALFRVEVHYVDLQKFLSEQKNVEIFAADMDGENLYTADLPHDAIVVMGNEGNGISDEVSTIVNRTIHIPSFNTTGSTSESLNVAVATAVICSEFKRRN